LLDTHVWIWWTIKHPDLGPTARRAVQTAEEAFLSVASVWEIVIKLQKRKVTLPSEIDLASNLAGDGFLTLQVELRHALGVAVLPGIHRDPFDRLLVSQALAEGLTIVTADEMIARYPVQVLDARA
jgi:PIN domain nuclease of toxin-antitoxin system